MPKQIAVALVLLVSANCATEHHSNSAVKSTGARQGNSAANITSLDLPKPPDPRTVWEMPPTFRDRQLSRPASRSIGPVTEGFLVGSRRLRSPHPYLHLINKYRDRALNYTSTELRDILEKAARKVYEKTEYTTFVGNLSAELGGDIPYSVSHNSGRDADVAFFLKQKNGEQVSPRQYIELDSKDSASTPADPPHFDVRANWWFVEGLLEAAGEQIKFVFISEELKKKLLDFAEKHERPSNIRKRAAEILHQPSNAPPHDEHFHIRIYCSEDDIRFGCRNIGKSPPNPKYRFKIREQTQQRLERLLQDSDPDTVRKALEQLDYLNATVSPAKLDELLDAKEPAVRIGAIRLLEPGREAIRLLEQRLEQESSPSVVASIGKALGEFESTPARETLLDLVKHPRTWKTSGGQSISSQLFTSEALLHYPTRDTVETIVTFLQRRTSKSGFEHLVEALRFMTNQKIIDRPIPKLTSHSKAAERWKKWLSERRRTSREDWVTEGFKAAGYDVESLDLSEAWAICSAIKGPSHISYNAQKTLMTLSNTNPDSLRWPKSDAHYYWARWLKRRQDRPDIPLKPEQFTLRE